MFKLFYPYEYVDSVFAIDYEKLQNKGYKGIIFDIDNTLVHHGEESTKEVDALFQEIHGLGLKTLLLSNNSDERIISFLENIDAPFISLADKPKTDNYFKAVEMLGIEKNEAVMVGDQLFTDIYGANLSGMANILVKYMRYEDEVKIGIRRNIEKVLLNFYQRNKTYQNRIGDIVRKGQD
ncbi:MAG: YqeG family HAD IIIA-type phosphatase [Vagococcus sp.]|uniref:YqeG family HAD IIIA-type phosphatase n=1 Tax=Vagococcus sp. TaxID=1933889 RepID=UPI002FCB3F16